MGKSKLQRYWTAAITRYSQEQRAAYHVERQGFKFYIPEMLTLTIRGTDQRELLFPGYIFIFLDPRCGDWRRLASTRGISRLLLCGETPTRMPMNEIKAIQSREDERGFVQLLPPLLAGDSVRTLESAGAYAGVRGLVRGMPARNRVRVLLQMLGRRVEVDLDRRVVALA